MADSNRLNDFVQWWKSGVNGNEKSEAQTFINRLFRAFGYEDAADAGGTFELPVPRRQGDKTSTGFADFVIPKRVLIEMKKRGEDLRRHYDQARNYWVDLGANRPVYVILCNFDVLWIYDFNTQVYDPVDIIPVEDLPRRAAALSFLLRIPQTPVFGNNTVEVTREAAANMGMLFRSLVERGIDRQKAQRFVLQCVVALFAEDINLLPDGTFTRLVREAEHGKVAEVTHDLFTLLFFMMNVKGLKEAGRFYGVPYFNGGLFDQINPIALQNEEIAFLNTATHHDWSKIQPAIFGTLFEESVEATERHAFGQHFTSERDILRIVEPVITRPWRKRIQEATSGEQLQVLHRALTQYHVLDPACGSGNFLSVAYREMKRLERSLIDRYAELAPNQPPLMPGVKTTQLYGMDISGFAVELAKVTLTLARKLAVDELHLDEPVLPLDNLDTNIQQADALFAEWPPFDACIGNPPYLGAKRLKEERGIDYVNRVHAAFPEISGNADYCVYWFRRAHDLMASEAQAGFVATNTITQNYSRKGSLDYITTHQGVIYDAVSSMKWSGEAKVFVSVVCWSKGAPPVEERLLWAQGQQAQAVSVINSDLTSRIFTGNASVLDVNTQPKRVFQGQTTGCDKAFVLTPKRASEMIRSNSTNSEVVLPYLSGEDLVGRPYAQPSRYVIDFAQRDIAEARRFVIPFRHVEQIGLPCKQDKAKQELLKNAEAQAINPRAKLNHDHETALNRWWQHFRTRQDRRDAMQLNGLKRYIVLSRVTKRPIFEFVDQRICPADGLQTFVFADDYTYGILQSTLHWVWFTKMASTLKGDFRYTPHSVFDTFPFPQTPTQSQISTVSSAGRAIHEWRRSRLAADPQVTMRVLYQLLELPGKNPLKDLVAALDQAVYAAYGFDPEADALTQLLALNQQVYTRIQAGQAVTAPGIPPSYPDPADLISEGCVQPPPLA